MKKTKDKLIDEVCVVLDRKILFCHEDGSCPYSNNSSDSVVCFNGKYVRPCRYHLQLYLNCGWWKLVK